jgi:hypothetical protein
MVHWEPSDHGGEAALVAGVEAYSYQASLAFNWAADTTRGGLQNIPLALYFGNLPILDIWLAKVMPVYEAMDLPVTRRFSVDGMEVFHLRSSCSLFLLLGQPRRAHALLAVLGCVWSSAGFECCDALSAAMGKATSSLKPAPDAVLMRLLMFLASPSPSPAIDTKAGAWIPTPPQLAQHERDYGYARQVGMMGILNLGARAFLKLGRDDDAVETAHIAVSVEQQTMQKYVLVECHSVLGQVAAKRGDVEDAGGHFGRALEEAAASRLPMLELLVARDWKRAVGESGKAADAVIDGACAKMGRTRAQLAPVL